MKRHAQVQPDRIGRSGWPSGPWDSEPDKIQWTDDLTGMPCLLARAARGQWCGYVAVPPEHPLYGRAAHELPMMAVHWGEITFAAQPGLTACIDHDGLDLPADEWLVGQPSGVELPWMIGFNAAHAGDRFPSDPHTGQWYRHDDSEYRRATYMAVNVSSLAIQLSLLLPPGLITPPAGDGRFHCPVCGSASTSGVDAADGYCGHCHDQVRMPMVALSLLPAPCLCRVGTAGGVDRLVVRPADCPQHGTETRCQ